MTRIRIFSSVRKLPTIIVVFLSLQYTQQVFAAVETSTTYESIQTVRPITYSGISEIYVTMDSNVLCGTSVFKIADGSGQEVLYSAVLSAFMADKEILVEVENCNGWGTPLRSIYLQD